ncbi:glycosyltransferase [Candidatus Bipolaricaulota bacterium]|nr:glycosyltransferase [Candidatus Bipolaricaulota bacterium]
MSPGSILLYTLSGLSVLVWIVLLFARGWFWVPGPWLEPDGSRKGADIDCTHPDRGWPPVAVIVPARNEVDVVDETIAKLVAQRYPGPLTITVVDDRSTDGTGDVLHKLATELCTSEPLPAGDDPISANVLRVVDGESLPPGWTGKVWAMQQGWEAVVSHDPAPGVSASFVLFTDADIAHAPDVVRQLVSKARAENRDLVSVMALLKLDSFWDRLLIPAFVYFFAKLYPFRWVGSASRRTAAAAGGCTLIRREALERIGGPACIASALIDDCALAREVSRQQGRDRVWLGMSRSESVRCARSYGSLRAIWQMVARSAFDELRYSASLLLLTVIGMLFVYAIPPVLAIAALNGVAHGNLVWLIPGTLGLSASAMMMVSFIPMLRVYGVSASMALLLPAGAGLYVAMTLTSALQTWAGRGGAWKGRTYSG